VTKNQADLARLEGNPSIESINILGPDWWRTMWDAQFLRRKKLYFETSTYFNATRLEGDWNLSFIEKTGEDLVHVSATSDNIIFVNPSYLLERNPVLLRARLGSGWYPTESTHRWMGSDGGLATVVIESRCQQLTVRVRASYWPLKAADHLAIYLGGRKIADCLDNRSCEIAGVTLSTGEHVLEFRASLTPALPGNGDPRLLSYAFNSIEITPTGSLGCETRGHETRNGKTSQ
jgi:hypothetical protein